MKQNNVDQAESMEAEGDFNQTIEKVLRVCKKGRWLIALMTLCAVSATTGVLAFVPSKYKSEATILVEEPTISPTLVAPLSDITVSQKLEAMTREILSRSRLLNIISEFDLYPKQRKSSPDLAVTMMREAIDIEPIDAKLGQFSAFSISFTAETPELAQEVTRTLAASFIESNLENQANRAKSTDNFLQEQIAEKRKKLEGVEQRIRDFKTQHLGALPEERISNEARRSEARSQLDSTVANLNRAKQQRIVWESTLTGEINSRLARAKAEKAVLLKNLTPQHPQVISKDEQIAQIESELAWVQAGAPSAQKPRGFSDSAVIQMEGQLQANALEIEGLSLEESRQTASVRQFEGRLNATLISEQQLDGLVREAQSLNTDIEDVQKKQQQSGLAVDMDRSQRGQQFRQLDPASLPIKPSSPQRSKISFGAIGVGAALGLVLAFLLDLKDSSFHSEDELRKCFAPPLLIGIPVMSTAQELQGRSRKMSFELFAGSIVAIAIIAVEFYAYRHP